MAHIGGGWYSEPYILPLRKHDFSQEDLPNQGKFTMHEGSNLPELISGNKEEWSKLASLIMYHPHNNDALILQELLRDNPGIYNTEDSILDARFVLNSNLQRELCDHLKKKLAAKFSYQIASREGITRGNFYQAAKSSVTSIETKCKIPVMGTPDNPFNVKTNDRPKDEPSSFVNYGDTTPAIRPVETANVMPDDRLKDDSSSFVDYSVTSPAIRPEDTANVIPDDHQKAGSSSFVDYGETSSAMRPVETANGMPDHQRRDGSSSFVDYGDTNPAMRPVETAKVMPDDRREENPGTFRESGDNPPMRPVENVNVMSDGRREEDSSKFRESGGENLAMRPVENANTMPDERREEDHSILRENVETDPAVRPVENANVITDDRHEEDHSSFRENEAIPAMRPVETANVMPDDRREKDHSTIRENVDTNPVMRPVETANVIPDTNPHLRTSVEGLNIRANDPNRDESRELKKETGHTFIHSYNWMFFCLISLFSVYMVHVSMLHRKLRKAKSNRLLSLAVRGNSEYVYF